MNKGYFEWLKSQVDFLDFPTQYTRLFSILHSTPFVWKHPMDENREIEARKELRSNYVQEIGRTISFTEPSSVLEVIIQISKRMNYICASFDEDKTKLIFWRLIANLGLDRLDDPHYEYLGGDQHVNYILSRLVNREYDIDGNNGGLFPMANSRENQREVELWYQMNQYLSDPNGEDLKSY